MEEFLDTDLLPFLKFLIAGFLKILWKFVYELGRLNRDYNPLIERKSHNPSIQLIEETEISQNVDEICVFESISECKDALLVIGALTLFTVLAFYKHKDLIRYFLIGSKKNNGRISNSSVDFKTLKSKVPADLQQKLLRLHSLLSVLPSETPSKPSLSNSSILPWNNVHQLQEIESTCSTELHQCSKLADVEYWQKVESGLQECLKALKAMMVDSRSVNCDKSIQVNEQLMFQILEGESVEVDRAMRPEIPVESSGFGPFSVFREHQQLEFMADDRRAKYHSDYLRPEMPMVETSRSSLDGNTLNIQIEFDRRVLLGKLAE